MIAVSRHGEVSRRSTLEHSRRMAVSVTAETVILAAVMDVDTGGGMAGVLVDGILHLAEEVVELYKILLRSGIRHRQVILLSKRVLRRRRAAVDHGGCWLRHVLFGGSHGAVRNREGTVERHERSSNLGIRGWVDLATFSVAEEVVDHVVGSLAIITTTSSGSTVTNVLSTGRVHGRLIEIQAITS